MRIAVVASVLCVPLLLGGCGDESAPRSTPSPSSDACRGETSPLPLVKADLDGDGVVDQVDYNASAGTCPASLSSSVKGLQRSEPVDWDVPASAGSAAAVRIPGRTGDVVLLREQHARGGFQAHLYGYADGALKELTVGGKPVFGFIATDVMTSPTAVTCTDGGFVVTQARAHEPIGVVPAWDIDRTTYTVDGNTVTKGATSEIADNVLDAQLERQYADLVKYDFFSECLVAQ
jgi:hypothetical protein